MTDERASRHLPSLELDLLAGAGEVVGPFAFDLERGEGRGDLLDRAGEARQDSLDLFRVSAEPR